jgi:hypothetical protein
MNYPHALNYPHASNHYVPNHHASGHHAPNHHFPSHHTPNHGQNHYAPSHGQNHYAPSHGQNHHAPSHGQSHHALSHHSQSHLAPSHHHASSHHAPNPLPLTHDYLTDGYISYTFGPRIAEGYVAHLFSIDAASVQTVRQGDAFYALNFPSYNIPPTLSVSGHDAWLLDFAVRSGGSVVPQQIWSPQGQGDRRRYVEQAQIRMPVFFINSDGSLGVPVMSAAAGDMQLHGVHLPPQLADKRTVKLRINVCTRFLRNPPSLTVCIAVAGVCSPRTTGPTEGSDSCKEPH